MQSHVSVAVLRFLFAVGEQLLHLVLQVLQVTHGGRQRLHILFPEAISSSKKLLFWQFVHTVVLVHEKQLFR